MDWIAAIATGSAATAIGIVRLSGEGCCAACDRVFRAANGRPFAQQEARKMVFGEMLDSQGQVIDRGLAVRFPGPNSYTGEDSAEFHCHGSPVVLRELLSALFQAGVRQAAPGEFTKRAFLNGRLDLTQAEAVVDLIDSETAAAARNAAAQLDGTLRRDFERVTQSLMDISSRFYAVVDYPDEDIPDIHPDEITDTLQDCDCTLSQLLDTCGRGNLLKRGVRTAIIGRPNAGKSSLLNALAGFDRAIVTNIPGTTRDTVEESVICGGVLLRLIDTAGIRDTDDTVERLGMERSRQAVETADLVLAVFDGSQPLTEEDADILQLASQQERWICLVNKADLPAAETALPEAAVPPLAKLSVSAVTGTGIHALEEVVASLFPEGTNTAGHTLTNPRQEAAVRQARDAVRRGLDAFAQGLTPDAVLTDVEEALDALGELTGRTAKEEIVQQIFSRFCVGK